MAGMTGAAAAAPLAASGGLCWHESLEDDASALSADLKGIDASAFTRAVWQQVTGDMESMLQGVRLYQAHPVSRPDSTRREVWCDGAARLFDFGGPGRPLLMVPSLVNRSDVLDLDEGASLAQWLADSTDVRPFLLDWGAPTDTERTFGLTDYVTGPLKGALDHVADVGGGPVPVLGYCMGGTLALSATQLWPDRVAGLALLATPWDFHADMSAQAKMFADAISLWRPVLDAYGEMPVDLLQSFFAALDPGLAQRKFARFARMDMDSPSARRFVLLEDWLNDGPPMAARVAMETIGGWFGHNTTANGQWIVEGQAIDPVRITCSTFIAIPANDRIVPPPSARAIADRVSDPVIVSPGSGHIGMVVGSRAEADLWSPLKSWLATVE